MPRMARVVLPHYPHHVVQRGHNRQVVFAEPADFQKYLNTLQEFKQEYGVEVYAYCLMTNHVHLLLSPSEPMAIGKLMKRLAGRQTRYHNNLEGRSGTLWEGRYKSSLVDTDNYLLACCRYVEMNPVRARMVEHPGDYPWSSCSGRLEGRDGQLLDLDPCYLALGNTFEERQKKYGKFLMGSIPDGEWEIIREAVQRCQLTGSDRFSSEVESIIGRRIERRRQGRPRCSDKSEK